MGEHSEPTPKKLDADQVTRVPTAEGAQEAATRRGGGTKSAPTGDPYIDHGAVCDGKDASETCFLTDKQRERLISQFQARIERAATNFKIAATDVRVEKLVEQEEELPLVAGILLDVLALHAATKIAHALTKLQSGGLGALEGIANTALRDGSHHDDRWYAHSSRALRALQEEHLKDNIEHAMDAVKDRAHLELNSLRHGPRSARKAASVEFIDILRSQAERGFVTMEQRLPAIANDAELIGLWEAFEPTNHQTAQYTAAITAKVTRFEASGVAKIRRFYSPEHYSDTDDDRRDYERGYNRHRETDVTVGNDPGAYVVWNTYLSGYPKQLVFEHAGVDLTVYGKPGRGNGKPGNNVHSLPGYGGAAGDHGEIAVDREFWDLAVARHTQVWGTPPLTVMVDDSDYHWDPPRAAAAMKHKTRSGHDSARPGDAKRAGASSSPRPVPIPDWLQIKPPQSTDGDL